jgi:hypothetical protein
VKRTLTFLVVIITSVVCFWYAFSGIDPLPAPGRGASATSAKQAPGSASHGGTRNLANNRATQFAPVGATGGSITIGSNAPSSKPGAGTANASSCKSKCQTTGSTCQSRCYQQYNVTEQTSSWSHCAQSCATDLSICTNDCVAGITPPQSSPTALLPSSLQATPPPLQSAKTPSLPADIPDSSSSSSSPSPSSSSSLPSALTPSTATSTLH